MTARTGALAFIATAMLLVAGCGSAADVRRRQNTPPTTTRNRRPQGTGTNTRPNRRNFGLNVPVGNGEIGRSLFWIVQAASLVRLSSRSGKVRQTPSVPAIGGPVPGTAQPDVSYPRRWRIRSTRASAAWQFRRPTPPS